MAKLSTHVLDTANGTPAEGINLELYRIEGSNQVLLKSLITNNDGRTDELLLSEETMQVGEYVIVFYVADYFAKSLKLSSILFHISYKLSFLCVLFF